jgi:hypothetical protein
MLLVLVVFGGSPTATPDLVATQVAVLRAAAATLTAEAPILESPAGHSPVSSSP